MQPYVLKGSGIACGY